MHQRNTITHIEGAAAPCSIYLVSCVSRKRERACRARELYVSDWFMKARAHVEATGSEWFIVSAAHGLLHPDERIAPYNVTLLRMPAPARRDWAALVLEQLAPTSRARRASSSLPANVIDNICCPPSKPAVTPSPYRSRASASANSSRGSRPDHESRPEPPRGHRPPLRHLL